jgi:hypothetical protein
MSTQKPNLTMDNSYQTGGTPGGGMMMMNGTPGITPGNMFNQTP